MLDQFGNLANPLAHYKGTGPEVWEQTKGRVTHFVSSMGTTGTIMGTSRYLKERNPDVRIVGLQPKEGSAIAGIRRWPKEYLPTIFQVTAKAACLRRHITRLLIMQDHVDSQNCSRLCSASTLATVPARLVCPVQQLCKIVVCDQKLPGQLARVICITCDPRHSLDRFALQAIMLRLKVAESKSCQG